MMEYKDPMPETPQERYERTGMKKPRYLSRSIVCPVCNGKITEGQGLYHVDETGQYGPFDDLECVQWDAGYSEERPKFKR